MATFHESQNAIPEVSRPAPATPPPTPAAAAPPAAPAASVQKPPPAPARTKPAHLDLTDPQTHQTKRIDLTREVTRLGRDPEGEVVIDISAAVVSRRHAEIKKSGEQFVINDLKSFNGTLVNGKRITETVQLFDRDEIQLGAGGPLLRLIDPAYPAPAQEIAWTSVSQPGGDSFRLWPDCRDGPAANYCLHWIGFDGPGNFVGIFAAAIAGAAFVRHSATAICGPRRLTTIFGLMAYRFRIITPALRATTAA